MRNGRVVATEAQGKLLTTRRLTRAFSNVDGVVFEAGLAFPHAAIAHCDPDGREFKQSDVTQPSDLQLLLNPYGNSKRPPRGTYPCTQNVKRAPSLPAPNCSIHSLPPRVIQLDGSPA